ncbi:MAG: hypothetical protein SFX18_08985 [Pirellulales bacterium]|nr:hypothetical protein [Pirellulales bacterium]
MLAARLQADKSRKNHDGILHLRINIERPTSDLEEEMDFLD